MLGFRKTLRNIGGQATAPGMAKAQGTALRPKRNVRHQGQGSSAGLNAEKTARLEPNGTGYSNIPQKPVKEYFKSDAGTIEAGPHYSRKTLHRTNSLIKPKFLTGR